MKKIISYVLVLTIVTCMLQIIPAEAVNSNTGYCGADETGENITWSYDQSTRSLIFSGIGEMKDYENKEKVPWSEYIGYYNSIIIGEGITKIGKNCLDYTSRMRKIELPGTLLGEIDLAYNTYELVLGEGIKTLTLPKGVYGSSNWSRANMIYLPESLTDVKQSDSYYMGGAFPASSNDQYSYQGTSYCFGKIAEVGKRLEKASSSFVFVDVSTTLSAEHLQATIENADAYIDKTEQELSVNANYQYGDVSIPLIEGEQYTVKSSKTETGKNVEIVLSGTKWFTGEKQFVVDYHACGSIEDPNAVHWDYDETTNILTFFGSGAIRDYTGANDTIPWSKYATTVKQIIIKDGITEVGTKALNYMGFTCGNLVYLEMPGTIQNVNNLGSNTINPKVIHFCEGIKNINSSVIGLCKKVYIDDSEASIKIDQKSDSNVNSPTLQGQVQYKKVIYGCSDKIEDYAELSGWIYKKSDTIDSISNGTVEEILVNPGSKKIAETEYHLTSAEDSSKPKPVLAYKCGEDYIPLYENLDYSVQYTNANKIGEAKLTITGYGSFSGILDIKYGIYAWGDEDLTCKLSDKQEMRDGKIVPVVSVFSYNGDVLQEGRDYELTYNLTKVQITPIGYYKRISRTTLYYDEDKTEITSDNRTTTQTESFTTEATTQIIGTTESNTGLKTVQRNSEIQVIHKVSSFLYKKVKYVVQSDQNSVVIQSARMVGSKFTIPNTISYKGRKYKVVGISSKAFCNNKKLTSIIIGKNIENIGNEAFKGCKNLKNVIIKTEKLDKKSLGKNVFKSVNKSVKIKIPKSKRVVYKKILKKKSVSLPIKVKVY